MGVDTHTLHRSLRHLGFDLDFDLGRSDLDLVFELGDGCMKWTFSFFLLLI